MTEEEVTYGLLQDSSPNDHCLFYFRELNDIEANLADETTKKYIDNDSYDLLSCNKEAQQLLRDLKEIRIPARVSSENIHQYAIPWCRGGVDPSNENHVSYLSSFCKQVKSDILRLINEAISKRSSFPAPYCLYEEIAHHASFCISKCESFCGRSDVLNAIRELLLSKIRKPLVVYGVSGSGKTSVMAKVQQNACAWLGSTCVTVLRFLGTSPSSSGIRGTLSSICQQLSLIYRITAPNLESMEFNEIVQYFHSLLIDMLPLIIKSHLLILLDSIDQLSPADGAHRMTWLPKLLPQNIHIILSMLPKEFGCLNVVRSLIPQEECYVETGAMSTCVGSEILDSWLSQAGRSLTKNQRSQVMRAFSLYPQPLFLRLLFHKTLTWFSYTNIDSNDLPRSTKDALNELFDQLQDHHGELLVSRSLGYFTSARNGLTETELEDVLSLDDKVLSDVYQYWDPPLESIIRIPQLVWKRVRYDISEFLVERQADGKTVIAWYHRQFIETTKNRYLKSDLDTKTCHLNLSTYFEGFQSTQTRPITLFHRKKTFYNISRQVATQPLVYKTGRYNLRKLSELPYNLVMAGEYEKLKHLTLCNFEWLFVKLQATSYHTTIQDFFLSTSLSTDIELSVVKEMLTLSAHRLKVQPKDLAGQILGRLNSINENNFMYPAVEQILKGALSWVDENEGCLLTPINSCLISPGGPLKTTLLGHSHLIQGIAVSQSLSILVSSSRTSDGVVFNVWDTSSLENMQILHSLVIYGDSLPYMTLTNELLVGACGHTLKIWNAITSEELKVVTSPSSIKCVTLLNLLDVIVVGTNDGKLLFIKRNTNDVIMLQSHTVSISALSFTGNNKFIISGASNGHVACHSTQSRSLIWHLQMYQDSKSISCIVTHHDCLYDVHYVIIGSEDASIQVRVAHNGILKHVLVGHKKAIKCLSLQSDEYNMRKSMILSCSLDSTIRMWNLYDGTCLKILTGHVDGITCLVISDEYAISGSKDDFLKVWNLKSGECTLTLEGHSSWISSVVILAKRQTIISGSNDKSLKLWNMKTPKSSQTCERHSTQPECIATTPCGMKVISGAPDSIKIWDTTSGKCLHTFTEPASCLCIHPFKSNLFFAGSKSGHMALCDLTCYKVIHTFMTQSIAVNCILVNQRLEHVYSACADGYIHTWSLKDFVFVKAYSGHEAGVKCITLSSENDILVSGSFDCTIRVVNVKSISEEVIVLKGHKKVVSCLDIAEDNTLLASGSDDCTLCLWDLKTSTILQVFRYADSVKCVSLSSLYNLVIAGAHCGKDQLKSWNIKSGECMNVYCGHTHAVMCMLTTHNDQYIVTGSRDGTIKVWRTNSAELLTSFDLQSQIKYMNLVAINAKSALLSATTKSGPIAILRLKLPV